MKKKSESEKEEEKEEKDEEARCSIIVLRPPDMMEKVDEIEKDEKERKGMEERHMESFTFLFFFMVCNIFL